MPKKSKAAEKRYLLNDSPHRSARRERARQGIRRALKDMVRAAPQVKGQEGKPRRSAGSLPFPFRPLYPVGPPTDDDLEEIAKALELLPTGEGSVIEALLFSFFGRYREDLEVSEVEDDLILNALRVSVPSMLNLNFIFAVELWLRAARSENYKESEYGKRRLSALGASLHPDTKAAKAWIGFSQAAHEIGPHYARFMKLLQGCRSCREAQENFEKEYKAALVTATSEMAKDSAEWELELARIITRTGVRYRKRTVYTGSSRFIPSAILQGCCTATMDKRGENHPDPESLSKQARRFSRMRFGYSQG
ncbi:MAG: hypothetical protein HY650_16660 [Acidobacteria bacterium]|nr:hypothetical protein [Acidobacteriota bacterium]